MKEKYIYPCVIYEEDGIYYANFKDFEACFTDGESIEEVIINAKDVLDLKKLDEEIKKYQQF